LAIDPLYLHRLLAGARFGRGGLFGAVDGEIVADISFDLFSKISPRFSRTSASSSRIDA
jgi:hypothetical protein